MAQRWSPVKSMRAKMVAKVLLALLVLAAMAGAAIEYRFGYVTGYQPGVGYPMVRSPSLFLDLKEFIGLEKFYSQLGQDKWILGKVFPRITDGFFVDVGAYDAEIDSNTKALEVRGWTGICVEPFPVNWTDRTCQLFKEVASASTPRDRNWRFSKGCPSPSTPWAPFRLNTTPRNRRGNRSESCWKRKDIALRESSWSTTGTCCLQPTARFKGRRTGASPARIPSSQTQEGQAAPPDFLVRVV